MGSDEVHSGTCPVRIVSRRMIQPPLSASEAVTNVHLAPWDLRLITIDYIQKGILLPKPPAGVAGERLVDALAASFMHALGTFYPFAGRLAVEPHDGGETLAVVLRCTGEGAEFIHAAAPGVTVAEITGSLRTPPVVWAFWPLNHVLGADAATESSLPVLSAQVTELADAVFVGMSLNHAVGDGTAFWAFFNTWSEINRGGGGISDDMISTLAPVPQRFFLDACPVPIRMPFRELGHIVRRFERPRVEEGFFTFSAASIRKLKARANDEIMADNTSIIISSLQTLLAHLWRGVSRARRLLPGQAITYTVVIGCRGRVDAIPQGYMGNAVVFGKVNSTPGEIQEKGLGWTAWQLNRAVGSFDEAAMEEWLDHWAREPDFHYPGNRLSGDALMTGSSPRFDVFGNDFGWGRPVAVRSGSGNKIDGKATVFEGPDRGGSMSLEVCVAPDVLERLLGDKEFMDAVSMPM